MFTLRSRDSLSIIPRYGIIVKCFSKLFSKFFALSFFMLHLYRQCIKKPATSYFPRQLPTKYHRR